MDQYMYFSSELVDHLDDMVNEFQQVAIDWLIARWPQLQSVTTHNVVKERLPLINFSGTRHRVFFHPCSCKDKQITDPVVNTSCYNHLRHRSLEETVIKQHWKQKDVPAEFIDFGWDGEKAKHPFDVDIREVTITDGSCLQGVLWDPVARA